MNQTAFGSCANCDSKLYTGEDLVLLLDRYFCDQKCLKDWVAQTARVVVVA